MFIDPSWEGIRGIVLAAFMKDCLSGRSVNGAIGQEKTFKITQDDQSISSQICEGPDCIDYDYKIIKALTVQQCQALAPYYPHKCLAANLVRVGNNGGGSIGWDHDHNIYGLFAAEGGKRVLVPLVNFVKLNDALNFMDTLK